MIKYNKILQGDSFDVLPTLEDNLIDLTCTSPPYNSIRDYEKFPILTQEKIITLGKELYRITKDGGICVVNIQDGTKDFAKSGTTAFWVTDWLRNTEWKLFETTIYKKFGKPGAWWNQRFRVDHEFILIFFKGSKPKSFDKSHMMVPAKHAGETWHGTERLTDGSLIQRTPKVQKATKCRGTIWDYSPSCVERNIAKLKHPATMPDKMASDIIKCFTKENDLVFDPFAGSGTTLIEAAKNNREYLGIEYSQEYVDIFNQRFKNEIESQIKF